MNKVVNIKSVKLSCAQCSLATLCLPRGLEKDEFDKVASIVQREWPMRKGEVLFEMGEPFRSLYAVQSGSLKALIPTSNGDEQIVGFNMPGELLGFDALGGDVHTCTTVALETSSVCELPFSKLNMIAEEIPSLNQHFMQLMSNEIADEHKMMLMLGKKSADERIASFLLSLSARFSKRGFSPNQFNLTMSRHDISNYLGLAVETISRCIGHLQDEHIIEAERKYIRIIDMPRLRKLAGITEQRCLLLEENAE